MKPSKGKLKNETLFVGAGHSIHDSAIDIPLGKTVTITNTEDHFIWGRRYQIFGFDLWFEENCFEYVELEDTK